MTKHLHRTRTSARVIVLTALAIVTILVGNLTAHHPQQSDLQMLAAMVARLAGARFGILPEGGNSAGAWLAGAVPHRVAGGRHAETPGLNWRAMAAAGLKDKTQTLLAVLAENPYQNPPSYEKLVGDRLLVAPRIKRAGRHIGAGGRAADAGIAVNDDG